MVPLRLAGRDDHEDLARPELVVQPRASASATLSWVSDDQKKLRAIAAMSKYDVGYADQLAAVGIGPTQLAETTEPDALADRADSISIAPAKRAPDVDDALRAAEAKRKKPDMGLGPARHLRRRAEATTATRACSAFSDPRRGIGLVSGASRARPQPRDRDRPR